jgi:hypothetical protein
MLDAGADADVDELLAGHADGGAGLDDARLHTHSHHNRVPDTGISFIKGRLSSQSSVVNQKKRLIISGFTFSESSRSRFESGSVRTSS